MNDNGVWAVMLPDFPEVFAPQVDVVALIEKEMTFHLHCPTSSLKKMDKVVVELRKDSEMEIVAPLADILLPQKSVWVISENAGRETVGRLIEVGHRRSMILHDSEDKREKRRGSNLPADLYFWVEQVMMGLYPRVTSVSDETKSRR